MHRFSLNGGRRSFALLPLLVACISLSMLSPLAGTTARADSVATTVYTNTVLASGNVLPQWQDTTGANVQSIVISNDSISALVYEVAGVQEIVPANTLYTAPILPNTTFRIYGQATQPSLLTSPTYPQTVTVDFSNNAVTGATSQTIRPTANTVVTPFATVTAVHTLVPNSTPGSITTTTLIAAIPGKRIVMTGIDIVIASGLGTAWPATQEVDAILSGNTLSFAALAVSSGNSADHVTFDPSFWMSVGEPLTVSYSQAVAGFGTVSILVRYYLA